MAAEFIRRAGEDARPGCDGRHPIVALPAIGTGHGGTGSHKGELYLALLGVLVGTAKEQQVDVVLVLKNARAYSAAQRARAHLLRTEHGGEKGALWDLVGEDASANLFQAATRLARTAREGLLVQFVGAGASAGLSPRAGIPPWQSLLDAVAESAGVEPASMRGLNLRDQATVLSHHLRAKGSTLAEVLTGHLTRSHYTLMHGLLASLGTKEHVTTNFDTMLESAMLAAGDRLAVLPYAAVEGRERWVLKLHGSVDQQGDGGDPLVITRDDYIAAPLRYGALYGIVQALLLTKHMLFVGYSLRDEDIHHLVHEVRAARGSRDPRKMGTVVTLFRTPAFEILWPDLDIVPMMDTAPDPDGVGVATAARRLHVFFDLVAFEAASLYRFLLDPDYKALLPDEDVGDGSDAHLREALEALRAAAQNESGPGWSPVRELLAEFGADPGTSQRPPNRIGGVKVLPSGDGQGEGDPHPRRRPAR